MSVKDRLADILQNLGLAALIGGIGDAIVNPNVRADWDMGGVLLGFTLILISLFLSALNAPK